jgi:hypothetical protein
MKRMLQTVLGGSCLAAAFLALWPVRYLVSPNWDLSVVDPPARR